MRPLGALLMDRVNTNAQVRTASWRLVALKVSIAPLETQVTHLGQANSREAQAL